jgi:hypothetical protein
MHSDFNELLEVFEKHGVRFLLIGGWAVGLHSTPRYTKDLDLLVDSSMENAKRVFSALREYGAPLSQISPEDFSDPGTFYQFGKPPLQVDILNTIPGVEFDAAWETRMIQQVGGIEIPVIGKQELIQAKQASGRPQDLIDVQQLQANWMKGKKTP